jgi:hypothetical protein
VLFVQLMHASPETRNNNLISSISPRGEHPFPITLQKLIITTYTVQYSRMFFLELTRVQKDKEPVARQHRASANELHREIVSLKHLTGTE